LTGEQQKMARSRGYFYAALLGNMLHSMLDRHAKNAARLVLRRTLHRRDNRIVLPMLAHMIGLRRLSYVTHRPLPGEGACSQALGMVLARCLAQGLGLPYAHTPLAELNHAEGPADDYARRWEKMLNLGQGKMTAVGASGPGVDVVDLYMSDMYNPRTIKRLYTMMIPLLPELRAAYSGSHSLAKNAKFTVALHIRRGDVTAERNVHMWTPLAEVRELAEAIIGVLQGLDIAYDLIVVSQGTEADFLEFADLDCGMVLNEDALASFQRLVDADVLILAKSSFSYFAGLLSNGLVIDPAQAYPPQPAWLTLENGLDVAEFETRLARYR
jgi:hypothetical protein